MTGKKYSVYSIREYDRGGKDGGASSVWVRAGSAWMNRDGSLNVYLDVLPLDGKLQVREAFVDKREGEGAGGVDAGASTTELRAH